LSSTLFFDSAPDDVTVDEEELDLVHFTVKGEDAGLALEIDQLQMSAEAEIFQGTF